jgi:hypothetical protein
MSTNGSAPALPVQHRVLQKVVSKAAFAREANSFGRNSMKEYRCF